MRVTVRLFARLRDLAGAGELNCELPAGARVADVWRWLVDRHPAVAVHGSSVSAALNAEYARMDAAVSDGDEVAFLPPVSGGRSRVRDSGRRPR
jgi:molybdopterin converting factor subunit 1